MSSRSMRSDGLLPEDAHGSYSSENMENHPSKVSKTVSDPSQKIHKVKKDVVLLVSHFGGKLGEKLEP